MNEFMLHLGALSLGGGLAALALMGTARFTHTRYAARWRCWVWLLLCLRLAIPLPLLPNRPAQQAPIQLPAVEDRVVLRPTPDTAAPGPVSSSPDPSVQTPPAQPSTSAPTATEPEPERAALSLSLSQILFLLWMLGAAVVLTRNLLAHRQFCQYLRRWAAPVRDADTLALYNALGDQLGLDRRPRLLTCPRLAVPMLAACSAGGRCFRALSSQESSMSRSMARAVSHTRGLNQWMVRTHRARVLRKISPRR